MCYTKVGYIRNACFSAGLEVASYSCKILDSIALVNTFKSFINLSFSMVFRIDIFVFLKFNDFPEEFRPKFIA